jgi:hypothetical protein
MSALRHTGLRCDNKTECLPVLNDNSVSQVSVGDNGIVRSLHKVNARPYALHLKVLKALLLNFVYAYTPEYVRRIEFWHRFNLICLLCKTEINLFRSYSRWASIVCSSNVKCNKHESKNLILNSF